LPLSQLSDAWPAEIRDALGAVDAATKAAIPHTHIAPGLARGKIACTWKQLRSWLTPAAPDSIAIEEETTLLLPLKIIAPAFLALKKSTAAPRKGVTLDESIPALFSGGKTQPEVQPAPSAPETPATSEAGDSELKLEKQEPVIAPPETAPPGGERVLEIAIEEPAASPQATEPASAKGEEAAAPESTAETPAAETPAAETPKAEPPAAETPAAQTLGEVLGEPDRTDWTPASLIKAVVKLPGVAGAVVALQEGFQVAHALPDGVNAETVSAFLPQIFTRLNQYAGEMKLGEVDDLLFTTRGAHCMIYRLGSLYLAVLGHPGETLPWNALRLVAAELSRLAQK
jgi:predicted regulator of Ras-like GTPase activity (Roadblock/LC7/MglB family)